VSERASVSDEVLRYHLERHAALCPTSRLDAEQTCPHGMVIALLCSCGDPLILVEHPRATCHCRLVEVAP
jgi:hypothetical protein